MAMAEPLRYLPRLAHRCAPALALCVSLFLSGCQSTGASNLLGKIFPSHDESLANGMVRPESATTERLLSRYLTPMKTPHASDAKEPKALTLGAEGMNPVQVAPNPQADAELDQATRLYRQGKYSEAEPLLIRIAKKHKGTPWGEKAQLLLADSYYERGKYVWANDAYEQLIKDYPGTEHLDKLVQREYEIAQKWLAGNRNDAKPEQKLTLAERFTGSAPLVDADGHAIKALENLRLHDPRRFTTTN
jgi:hypothetical protein